MATNTEQAPIIREDASWDEIHTLLPAIQSATSAKTLFGESGGIGGKVGNVLWKAAVEIIKGRTALKELKETFAELEKSCEETKAKLKKAEDLAQKHFGEQFVLDDYQALTEHGTLADAVRSVQRMFELEEVAAQNGILLDKEGLETVNKERQDLRQEVKTLLREVKDLKDIPDKAPKQLQPDAQPPPVTQSSSNVVETAPAEQKASHVKTGPAEKEPNEAEPTPKGAGSKDDPIQLDKDKEFQTQGRKTGGKKKDAQKEKPPSYIVWHPSGDLSVEEVKGGPKTFVHGVERRSACLLTGHTQKGTAVTVLQVGRKTQLGQQDYEAKTGKTKPMEFFHFEVTFGNSKPTLAVSRKNILREYALVREHVKNNPRAPASASRRIQEGKSYADATRESRSERVIRIEQAPRESYSDRKQEKEVDGYFITAEEMEAFKRTQAILAKVFQRR